MQPLVSLWIHTAECPVLPTGTYRHTPALTHCLGKPSHLHSHTRPRAHTSHAHTYLSPPGASPAALASLLSAMTFSKLVDSVNSKGPFQFLIVVLLGLPILGMANHNLLQIFTAATPAHHCRPPPNASAGPWMLPTGLNGKPEPCLRFVYPPNTSLPNDTQGATEPCLDGWVYNISIRDSIVTEVCPEATPLLPLRAGPTPCSALGQESRPQGQGMGQGTGSWAADRKELGAVAYQPRGLVSRHPECKHFSSKHPVLWFYDRHRAKPWGRRTARSLLPRAPQPRGGHTDY